MALVPVDSTYGAALIDLEDIGSSVESLARLVESQKELFHSQIDQLQKIVVTQCKLTGANPLAQEMAAGALSIKIGKRPRDLLNPKAVKYMQSIFSIKDTIGKKETREISALCGITVTQVRDYFSSQRSRVRKLVRLSHEKTTECDASKAITDGSSDSSYHSAPASKDIPGSKTDLGIVGDSTQIPGHSGNAAPVNFQSLATPLNAIPVCTQFPANPDNFISICSQAYGNSGNVTTVGTLVNGSLVNATPLSTVAPVYSGNFSSVFTPIIGYSGIVNAVGTLVPGRCMNGTQVQDGLLGPTKANIKPMEESSMKANIKPMEESSMKANIKPMEEGPSCSSQEETTPGVDSDDKKFLENIFSLMRKEQTFSGRVKLMEWVLQIHNSAVLSWFSTKGGITILATWLSEAAFEEQTTVLLVIFKVLCHLPLNKAQPVQMSAILQTVNRLRFYRSSDISNRAKVLLSRWSKMFVRSQALRNSRNFIKNGQKGTIHKQRTNEVLGDESWKSNLDIPEEILALAGSAEDGRETEPNKALKLLTDSSEGSTRKHARTVITTKTKERRKVLLVENPDSKAGRSAPAARAVPSNHSRPMSADDIQKAKMRAIHMQDKYGKSNSPVSENSPPKAEDHTASPASHGSNSSPANTIPQLPLLRRPEPKKSPVLTDQSSLPKAVTSDDLKPNLTPQEQMLEKLKKNQIQWRTPPEVRLNSSWRVGVGENSKEVQVQAQRNRREKETLYADPRDIPLNPKEPWDIEMDFDDSLTPEIPVDQPSDSESPLCSPTGDNAASNATAAAAVELPSTSAAAAAGTTVPSPAATGNAVPEPDAELLLVLLQNPEVVEALTKGEGRNLTEEQLVALLDMVKRAGSGATGLLDGLANGSFAWPGEAEPEPVSLPSPTPPSRNWRPEFPSPARGASVVLPPPPSPSMMPARPQALATIMSLPQLTVTMNPSQQQQQQLPVPNLQPTKQPGSMYSSFHQSTATHYQANNHLVQPLPPPPLKPAWPPADGTADFSRRDPMPDYRNGRVPLDGPVTSTSNYYANNDNNYHTNTNSYNVHARVNEYVPIPEGGPAVGPPEPREFPYDARSYTEFDRSHKWPRQRHWSSGQRNPYGGGGGRGGGGRWRDRDGRR